MMSHSSFFSPRSGRWLSVTEILLMGGFKPQLSPSFIVLIEICWGGGVGGGVGRMRQRRFVSYITGVFN